MGARNKRRKRQIQQKRNGLIGRTITVIVRLAADTQMVYVGKIMAVERDSIGVKIDSLKGKILWLANGYDGNNFVGAMVAGKRDLALSGYLQ